MVLEAAWSVFEAIQNAILIAFMTVFDGIFGLAWFEGPVVEWAVIAILILAVIFL